MPPRTRTRKDLKENIDVVKKKKVKNSDGKITKPPRKALADKTNSLSDDNASIDVPIKTSKNKAAKIVSKDEVRPRRDRRLPIRYVENQALKNLSNSRESSVIYVTETSTKSEPPYKVVNEEQHPIKNAEVKVTSRPKRNCRLQSAKELAKQPETTAKSSICTSSPFKTPTQSLDSSLVSNRPKRICRLPSKFEDHSISPTKFIPVQPCHASTPMVKNNAKRQATSNEVTKPDQEKQPTRKHKENAKNDVKTKGIEYYFSKSQMNHRTNAVKITSCLYKDKTSPDTNNNPRSKRLARNVVSTKSPTKQSSPEKSSKTNIGKRLLEKNLSFKVLEDRQSQEKNEDVYEFTYDPAEEPLPQKKKRKRVVKKKPAKPKTVVLKNSYDKNVQKALESLKSMVKPSQSQNTQPQSQNTLPQSPNTQIPSQSRNIQPQSLNAQPQSQNIQSQSQNIQPQSENIQPQPQNKQSHPQKLTTQPQILSSKNPTPKIQILEDVIIKPVKENKLNYTPAEPVNESAKSIHMSNYASIRVEDIAADFDESNDINYSPVNSPSHPKTPENPQNHLLEKVMAIDSFAINHKDPLNLQGDLSFFDENPVASSSMNISVRHPEASPWRVEFGSLPIKWQANTYLKPNMTPAVESSFINSEEISKKKHVYTNIVAEEPLPQIEDPPQLKQTSIISFMKEVAERSLKKKRGRSMSPAKANSLFEDMSTSNFGYKTPKKARKDKEVVTPTSITSKDKSCENQSSNKNHDSKNHNENDENSNPKENSNQSDKSSTKKSKKNKDGTFFGFDESESYDQENVSPVKNIQHTRARGLRSKSRAVLQEINAMSGPMRAVLPVTAKNKLASSDVVEKLYDQLKSAEDAPQTTVNRKADESVTNEPLTDDDQSVHLFEDIEVIHHLKPHRKSYGKVKKVTFRQPSNSDSDTQIQAPDEGSSDDDDLADLTFQMPNIKEKVTKRKKKKKQLSKKEEKEVEEWAAGFNSMCEDIDEFPLVVE